MNFIVI